MILIQNIYHMLSYAFRVLNEQGYKHIATEKFDNTAELCAAILSRGIAVQVKRGLHQEYTTVTENRSLIRGKLEISDSIKNCTILKRQMICTYDKFSTNSYINQIVKSTISLLLRSDITNARKKELRKWIIYFSGMKELDVHRINWKIPYNQNNQTYRMLISVCYLVVKGLLQTQSDGSMKLMDFLDEQQMYRLYEKFVLEYYRREFPQITTSAPRISWQLDDDKNEHLPIMQSDVMLSYMDKVLIIDTKYYGRIMQERYEVRTIHSANLYQIFTYVKNKEVELSGRRHEVSGMLLYAGTDEALVPCNEYRMSGNKISVRTLDLNQNFSEIKKQLNHIAELYLGVKPERRDDRWRSNQ